MCTGDQSKAWDSCGIGAWGVPAAKALEGMDEEMGNLIVLG